ncbi:MAG: glycosyltransferase [Planctomycetota bacterium]
MQIAYLVTSFPALSATFILNQITGLVARGHDVHIYGDRPGDTENISDEVHRLKLLDVTTAPPMPSTAVARLACSPLPFARLMMRRPGIALRSLRASMYGGQAKNLNLLYCADSIKSPQTYDAIHAHFGPNGVRGTFLRDVGLLNGPLLTTFHGYDMTRTVRGAGRNAYEHLFATGDRFLPISEHWLERLLDLGAPASRTIVHHMGIDPTQFTYTPRLRDDTSPTKILSIARLVDKKGIEYAIRAIARTESPIQYRVAGDGPLRAELEALIDACNVRDRVEILGWKSNAEIRALLDESHLLLAPSVTAADGDKEGIPVVLMEAMAMGIPVISTVHSGIPELVDHNVSGLLVEERNVESLAEAIESLCRTPDVWASMGRAGADVVEANFNIDRLNDDLVKHFEAASNRHSDD